MAADERTSIVAARNTRKYGAAISSDDHTSFVRHAVQPTDTINHIALKYKVSPSRIRRANHLVSENSIHAMKEIIVPVPTGTKGSGVETVANGDVQDAKTAKGKARLQKEKEPEPNDEAKPASALDFLSKFDAQFSATKASVEKAARACAYRSPSSSARHFNIAAVEEPKDNEQLLLDDSLHEL